MSYYEFMADKTVAIVGPAPSIIGGKSGGFIDSHDIVVRINKAVPIPAELYDDVGTRTDVLYNCLNESIECGGPSDINKWVVNGVRWLVCPYPDMKPFSRDIAAFSAKLQQYKDCRLPFRIMDLQLYNRYASQMKCRPNSGICAIIDILSMPIKSLYITGFTFFKGGYYPQYRPYTEAQVISKMSRGGSDRHVQEPQFQAVKAMLLNDARVTTDSTLKHLLSQPSLGINEKLVDKSAEELDEKPADKPAKKPAKKPADKPAKKPAENPAKKPAEKPAKKPVGLEQRTRLFGTVRL